jgi:hypothetical protein
MAEQLTDQHLMPMGNHRGRPLGTVPMSYWHWFLAQDWSAKFPALQDYARNRVTPFGVQTPRVAPTVPAVAPKPVPAPDPTASGIGAPKGKLTVADWIGEMRRVVEEAKPWKPDAAGFRRARERGLQKFNENHQFDKNRL